jgi:hypothetical protein
MSAKIIPFRSADSGQHASANNAVADAPMTPEAVHAAIQKLEAVDRELQIQAHAISLAIGEVRRQRLTLLKQIEASRSA